MKTQPLCNFTATVSDITPTVSLTSHPLDQYYQTQCIYDITVTMCMTSSALPVTSHPQFRISHHFMYVIRSTLSNLTPLYHCHHTHPIDDITATICMTSLPVHLWHHIHFIYDIISTKNDITTLFWWHNTRHMYDIVCTADENPPSLSHQTTVFMISHPLQAWQHSPCIRHHTHCFYVITQSPLTS